MNDEEAVEPEATEPPQAEGDSGLSWGLAVFLVLALVVVVFVVQNSGNVAVKLLNWEGSFPLPVIITVTVLVSVVADEVLGLMRRRRRRRIRAERAELERYRRT